jgi:hypothetical protein
MPGPTTEQVLPMEKRSSCEDADGHRGAGNMRGRNLYSIQVLIPLLCFVALPTALARQGAQIEELTIEASLNSRHILRETTWQK